MNKDTKWIQRQLDALPNVERAPRGKQVVFYCGCNTVTPGRELARATQVPLEGEIKIESISDLQEWVTLQFVAGRSYYIDVREE